MLSFLPCRKEMKKKEKKKGLSTLSFLLLLLLLLFACVYFVPSAVGHPRLYGVS